MKEIPTPKHLKKKWPRSYGRNNKGRISAWHRGGGHSSLYRQIDLDRKDLQGIVICLEKDPNRFAFLARVFNPDTQNQAYIIAPKDLKKGDIIRSGKLKDLQIGHSRPLRHIPTASFLHNLSQAPGKKAQYLRAPGAFGHLVKKTYTQALIKLQSGEYKYFPLESIATVGIVGNQDWKLMSLGKAGKSRHLGRRPRVRGVAMNPVDHPHGGGEGKTSGGRPSVTPWGKPTKGQATVLKKRKRKI
uniref:Ribosomal protein L2 n=1 Tax=Schizocladia ischiensis TaxID=196139 RepID=A0A7S6UA24_9STRA|nr:ribosomal protein L2 [Schizocladia ischiensis]QOW07597.1 ribosomal protein L2 [Schizocladia ischiensis]